MRPRLPRPPRLAGATTARAFRRAWRRAAARLPVLGRSGRWIADLQELTPHLAAGPRFGTALADLTAPEPARREAPPRKTPRREPAETPVTAPLSAAGPPRAGTSGQRRANAADIPNTAAAVRNLP